MLFTGTCPQVDITDDSNKPIAIGFGVRSFPYLKIFRGGNYTHGTDYQAIAKDSDSILTYLKTISGPASSLLSSTEAVESFKAEEAVPVLAYFESSQGEAVTAYLKAIDALRNDYGFAHITNASLMKVRCPPPPPPGLRLSAAVGALICVRSTRVKEFGCWQLSHLELRALSLLAPLPIPGHRSVRAANLAL